ncbi:VOC family protein [Ruania zhangjianzhongii]|uniref:VOC family protein n=1 Tax=Ruania zhangjianzhongii TaxID=2603206 RepID=UPI00143DE935|nr:VOC family protein [Ruania zhangjianzhongii]
MTCDFFLYARSTDLAAARHFYTDLLALEQIWDEADSIAYTIGSTVQFSIGLELGAPAPSEWSFQPGWVYGLDVDPAPRHAPASWSIRLDAEHFAAAVARLQTAGVEALQPEPFWVGYWSFVVRDPMGYTVELADPASPQS